MFEKIEAKSGKRRRRRRRIAARKTKEKRREKNSHQKQINVNMYGAAAVAVSFSSFFLSFFCFFAFDGWAKIDALNRKIVIYPKLISFSVFLFFFSFDLFLRLLFYNILMYCVMGIVMGSFTFTAFFSGCCFLIFVSKYENSNTIDKWFFFLSFRMY